MSVGETVGVRILELCKERKITLNRLATICGMTQSTLNNIVSGESKDPRISTIKKICDGLGLTLPQFFDVELFNQLEQEII